MPLLNPVEISWFFLFLHWYDQGQFAVDVDLQAVIVDQKGVCGTEFADFGLFFENNASSFLLVESATSSADNAI